MLTRPERQHPLLPPYLRRAIHTIPVQPPRLDTLHPRLNRIQRLCNVHRDQACCAAERECGQGAEFLAGPRVGFGELPEGCVGAEAGGGVGGLPGGGGEEALEEAADALGGPDDGGAVEEAAHLWVGGFAVVDAGGGGGWSVCRGRG